MTLMVQDLTNPMLAQIPHMHLAARTGTVAKVQTNSMQFIRPPPQLRQRCTRASICDAMAKLTSPHSPAPASATDWTKSIEHASVAAFGVSE